MHEPIGDPGHQVPPDKLLRSKASTASTRATTFRVPECVLSLTPRQSNLRAQIAATNRHHPEADVSELVTELRTVTAAEYIRKLVDSAPPLSEDQRARLATLLAPGGGSVAA